MKETRQIEVIKLLLRNIILRQREEEAFLKKLNDNTELYDICVHSKFDNLIYDLAQILEIDEVKSDKIYDEILDNNVNIDQIVNELCCECGIE